MPIAKSKFLGTRTRIIANCCTIHTVRTARDSIFIVLLYKSLGRPSTCIVRLVLYSVHHACIRYTRMYCSV